MLEPDATGSLVACRLGEVGILAREDKTLVRCCQFDVDETVQRGTYAVFECILYERDEDERCHVEVFIFNVGLERHIHVLGYAQLHKFYVALHEVEFLVEHHAVALVLVEHIAEHEAEFVYGMLCLFAVESGEGVDVVERVEQKMGINLVLQILQFGLRPTEFGLCTRPFALSPLQAETQSHGSGYHEHEGKEPAYDEKYFRREMLLESRVGLILRSVEHVEMRLQFYAAHKYKTHQYVHRHKSLNALTVYDETGNEQEIVDIKGDARTEGERHGVEKMVPIDVLVAAFEEKGRKEDVAPRQDVHYHFYAPFRCRAFDVW